MRLAQKSFTTHSTNSFSILIKWLLKTYTLEDNPNKFLNIFFNLLKRIYTSFNVGRLLQAMYISKYHSHIQLLSSKHFCSRWQEMQSIKIIIFDILAILLNKFICCNWSCQKYKKSYASKITRITNKKIMKEMKFISSIYVLN